MFKIRLFASESKRAPLKDFTFAQNHFCLSEICKILRVRPSCIDAGTDVGDEMCWRQHSDVGDGFEPKLLAVLVTNIFYLLTLASGTNIQKMSQYRNLLTKT